MKLIESEWLKFRRATLPATMGVVQGVEMRRAFYAGAWAFYSMVMRRLDADSEPTAEDLAMMAAVDTELREFFAGLATGQS
jgi:hypothetical protein